MSSIDGILKHGIEEFQPLLEPASFEFLARVFADGLEKYRRRLTQYGLDRCTHVLDAGCGFGQWSLALAELGVRVTAVDTQPDRLIVLKTLAGRLGIDSLQTRHAGLQDLPFSDRSFDGVLCYGALHLTPWRQSIDELARVLAPGGVLYANANGFGYFHSIWESQRNRSSGYSPRRAAGLALLNTWKYEERGEHDGSGPLVIEPDTLIEAFATAGLTNIRNGPEGTVTAPHIAEPCGPPFFPGEYRGSVAVHEILATKA